MSTTGLHLMYYVLTVLIGAFGLLALVKLWKMDLSGLVTETGSHPGSQGKASLSRFQALLFTFVIAGLMLVLSIEHGEMVEVPETVLGILGISIGGYTLSKGIQGSKKDGSQDGGQTGGGQAGGDQAGGGQAGGGQGQGGA